MKKGINKTSKIQKISYIFLMFIFISFSILSVVIPTLAKPNGNIQINGHIWNTLNENVETVYLGANTNFSIESLDAEEIYYLISSEVLSASELNNQTWIQYSSPVMINEEGSYIIYAKLVDNDMAEVSYINTDLLVLDYYSINLDDNSWASLRNELNNLYINEGKNVRIDAKDDLVGIKNIKYYVSNELLSLEDVENLANWTLYTEPILINQIGAYVVYARIMDNNDNVAYINSDYIILDGYTEDFIIGRNLSSYLNEEAYITNKSTVTLNFTYFNNAAVELTDFTHNLVSSLVLPLGAKLTLIDRITEKVYIYEVNEIDNNYVNGCGEIDCVYPLTLFKEIGKNDENFYSEMTYYENEVIEESFTVILDLSKTDITSNFENVKVYFALKDTNGNIVRPTLNNTIKSFNIYSEVEGQNASARLYLNTNYSGNAIEFNSDSTTSININSGLAYKYVNDFKVIDTTYENKEMGLAIRLVDSGGNVVEKELLRSILFKIGDVVYHPESDNIIRIKLNTGIEEASKMLKIITFYNNGILKEGTYYFKISNYVSYDGYYYEVLGNDEISIPLNVTDNLNAPYSFGVIMNDANRVINKETETVNVPFQILQNGELEQPNIRISLYKKDKVTAYDQNYTMVNLADYVENVLSVCEENVYYVSTNPVQYIAPEFLYNTFELNLITANFENTGYKFVFELYDGTKLIGTIEKYFIVKGEYHE